MDTSPRVASSPSDSARGVSSDSRSSSASASKSNSPDDKSRVRVVGSAWVSAEPGMPVMSRSRCSARTDGKHLSASTSRICALSTETEVVGTPLSKAADSTMDCRTSRRFSRGGRGSAVLSSPSVAGGMPPAVPGLFGEPGVKAGVKAHAGGAGEAEEAPIKRSRASGIDTRNRACTSVAAGGASTASASLRMAASTSRCSSVSVFPTSTSAVSAEEEASASASPKKRRRAPPAALVASTSLCCRSGEMKSDVRSTSAFECASARLR
mmetsp:Transcript_32438/g.104756  ORF Transcript_32438/g.104756 Transcript_32438/m.104756 type:complete len:267 (-) Transcript_32438:570-1370(-)